jgi:hypothetical protein
MSRVWNFWGKKKRATGICLRTTKLFKLIAHFFFCFVESFGMLLLAKIHATHDYEVSCEVLYVARDSAHVVHPLAGQGVNLGIADAYELTQTLIEALKLGIDVGV